MKNVHFRDHKYNLKKMLQKYSLDMKTKNYMHFLKQEKKKQVLKIITSTLESFPSSSTLKIANPAGVSNSRSILSP